MYRKLSLTALLALALITAAGVQSADAGGRSVVRTGPYGRSVSKDVWRSYNPVANSFNRSVTHTGVYGQKLYRNQTLTPHGHGAATVTRQVVGPYGGGANGTTYWQRY